MTYFQSLIFSSLFIKLHDQKLLTSMDLEFYVIRYCGLTKYSQHAKQVLFQMTVSRLKAIVILLKGTQYSNWL